MNISLSNQQRKKYIIEYYENKTINNSTRNIQKYKEDKLLENKKIGFKIYKKHYASKSQENIKENSSKYNHLFKKKNIQILKKVEFYEYYKKRIKFILKIQNWWKDMLFHIISLKNYIFLNK